MLAPNRSSGTTCGFPVTVPCRAWLDPSATRPPGSAGGPAVVVGTKLDSQLPLVSGLYQVDLSPGTTVAAALAAYQSEPGVLDAEPDYLLTVSSVPNDPMFSQQWDLNNTGQAGGTSGADMVKSLLGLAAS